MLKTIVVTGAGTVTVRGRMRLQVWGRVAILVMARLRLGQSTMYAVGVMVMQG